LSSRLSVLIFDLDNCLAAADEPGKSLLDPVFTAIRASNMGAIADDELQTALDELWGQSFDVVAERHGFSPAMRDAGWRAFLALEVGAPMHGYGDLDLLPSLGRRRFLVTTGFRRLQESKVRALGIGPMFEAVTIDAIEEPDHPGKERIFADLVAEHRLERNHVVVIGDNPDSELAAARLLGLQAVQIVRPGVKPADRYDRVSGLAGLRGWLERMT
jgi:putative hydrolase of the HAD superfamily